MWKRSPQRSMPVELDDTEKAALAAELKRLIAADPFPMSLRIRTSLSWPPRSTAATMPAHKPQASPAMCCTRRAASLAF